MILVFTTSNRGKELDSGFTVKVKTSFLISRCSGHQAAGFVPWVAVDRAESDGHRGLGLARRKGGFNEFVFWKCSRLFR